MACLNCFALVPRNHGLHQRDGDQLKLKPNARNVLTIVYPRDYQQEVGIKDEEARPIVKQVRDKYNAVHKAILILETGPPRQDYQQHNIIRAFKFHTGLVDADDRSNNRLESRCNSFDVNLALLDKALYMEGRKKEYEIVGCTDKSIGEIRAIGKEWAALHPELDADDSNCFEYVDSVVKMILLCENAV